MKEKIKYDIEDEVAIPENRESDNKRRIGKISMITITKKVIKYRIYNGFNQIDINQEDLE